MGLEFNEEKTGTARLGNKKLRLPDLAIGSPREAASGDDAMSIPASNSAVEADILPKGDVRWGFLKLDEEAGRFLIDQKAVDVHIKELRRQLSACKSVFGWVQGWNSYLALFFSNNFGKPAMCFGRPHIEMVISTLQRIEHELFLKSDTDTSSPSNVTEYLREVIRERFGVDDLPDGFFYFPVELGGLELRNPFIPFLAMREDIRITPERILEKAFVADEKAYVAAKKKFEKYGPSYKGKLVLNAQSLTGTDQSAFMPLDEYMRYCESTSRHLQEAYMELLSHPNEAPVDRTPELQSAQARLAATPTLPSRSAISAQWNNMSSYWKWVAELYHGDMTKKYGGLMAVEPGVVPLGVVKVLKEGKVRWHG
jgi:hypothetical protein